MPIAALSLLLLSQATLAADSPAPLQVGQRLASFSIEDQHGNKQAIDETTQAILFSADMDANDLVKQALSGERVNLRPGAVYVADISGMPGIITSLFALPAMRKRPYPMLLDRDGELTRNWPRQKGQVALIELEGLTVKGIAFLATAGAIRDRLVVPATTP
jgi:hypothetical protein